MERFSEAFLCPPLVLQKQLVQQSLEEESPLFRFLYPFSSFMHTLALIHFYHTKPLGDQPSHSLIGCPSWSKGERKHFVSPQTRPTATGSFSRRYVELKANTVKVFVRAVLPICMCTHTVHILTSKLAAAAAALSSCFLRDVSTTQARCVLITHNDIHGHI